MNFFNNRIVMKPGVSIEAAVAAAKPAPQVRSLDDILADIDAKNKGLKTASTEATVKTAASEAPKAEAAANIEPAPAPVSAPVQKTASVQVEVKTAAAEAPKAEAAKVETPAPKPTKLALKIAKSLDFRQWEAQDVVKAWGQHGSYEKCCANVNGKVSDAKAYCGLLQVASQEAGRVIKTAKLQAEQKVAAKEEVAEGRFKKLAKLTDKERSWLAKYWGQLYGDEYVKAMLEDY